MFVLVLILVSKISPLAADAAKLQPAQLLTVHSAAAAAAALLAQVGHL